MVYNIVSYGAIPNSGHVNTVPIQSAIDACSAAGGGTVLVPSGLFVSGTLYLKSNVELHLEMGAELKASTKREDYNTADAYPENWCAPNEGWDERHFIIAHHVENVAITGLGKINGSAEIFFDGEAYDPGFGGIWSYGLHYQKGFWYGMEKSDNPRPGQTVVFVDSKNIRVTDITIINSPAWCLFLHGCENVQIRGYKAFNERAWANTDGIDIDCCKNVTVSDCIIDTGDDAIAIRCSSAQLKNGRTACENITITNCVFESSSSVFRIGVGAGEIRNVAISNIVIRRGGIAFTIATHFSDACHGLLEDIHISNIIAENTTVPFELYAKKDCYIKNISFVNYRAKCFKGAMIVASDDAQIRNITVRDMNLLITQPPFTHKLLDENSNNYLFYAENAENVKFENITTEIPEDLCKYFKGDIQTVNCK